MTVPHRTAVEGLQRARPGRDTLGLGDGLIDRSSRVFAYAVNFARRKAGAVEQPLQRYRPTSRQFRSNERCGEMSRVGGDTDARGRRFSNEAAQTSRLSVRYARLGYRAVQNVTGSLPHVTGSLPPTVRRWPYVTGPRQPECSAIAPEHEDDHATKRRRLERLSVIFGTSRGRRWAYAGGRVFHHARRRPTTHPVPDDRVLKGCCHG